MEKASRYDASQIGKIMDVMGWDASTVVEKLKVFGTNITPQTILNWRDAKSAPDADMIDVLAMALGVGLERFYPPK